MHQEKQQAAILIVNRANKGVNMIQKLVKYLIVQEFVYAGFCFAIALLVSLNHGFYSGLKAFGYCFLFLQPVIIIVNRGILLELIKGNKNLN